MSGIVVCGIGNEYRGDDAAGILVARMAARRCRSVSEVGPLGEPLQLLDHLEPGALAVVVDATCSGRPPGTISEVELDGSPDPAAGATSTHGIGVLGALRIARILGRAPRRVVLVGIEGATFADGRRLSPAVRRALPRATRRVVELVTAAA